MDKIASFFCLLAFMTFLACGNENVKKDNGEFAYTEMSGHSDGHGTVLVLHPAKIDFGKVSKEEHPELKFKVRLENKGSKPLVINKTDVSCGCMSFDVRQKTILPGKIVMASVVVKSEGNTGYFNKAVFIRSTADNDLEIIRVKGEFVD